MKARRIVLLGKQGAGKSRLANLIFGGTVFEVNCSSKSLMSECQVETKSVNGRSITLIDTPGLFGSGRSEVELKSEIVRYITECAPGPHAFLIVLKVEKFTAQEQAVIENILQCFSEDAFKYAAVVFTHDEELLKGLKTEEMVSQNKHLSDLVKKCGGRCHVVDDKYWKNNKEDSYRRNQLQAAELLNIIDKMVMENRRVHNNASKNVWIKLTGPAAESLAKSFSGPVVAVSQENKVLRRGAEEGAAEEEGAAVMPISPEREAEGVEHTGRGGTTVKVKTVSASPTRIVIAGTARAGRSIKVLKTCRIVLLGKTRAGKSSLGNTIFGEDVFKTNNTRSCGTRECQTASKSVDGRRITLIDAPGFFDFSSSEEELKVEMDRCITECAARPHAFFIVLKVEEITKQGMDVISRISQYFSEEALKYAAVVFTHGDQLPQGMKIEEFVDQNKCLSDLVEKCGGRCHVVDNKYWNDNQHSDDRSNRFQVAELLNTADKIMTENKGGCYTNNMLRAVKRGIEEEGVRETIGNVTQGDTSRKADSSISKNEWIKFTGAAAESLAGAFFGPAVIVLQESGGENEDGGEVEEEEEAEEPAAEVKKDVKEKPAETEEEEEGDTETEEEAEEEAAAAEIKKETGQGRSAGGGGLGFLGGLFGFFSGIAAGLGTLLGGLFGFFSGISTGLGTCLGGLFGAGAAAAGAGAAAAGAGAAAAVAAVAAVALTSLTFFGLIAGAIAWLVSKIKDFLKKLPRHIGIVLLVVVFLSLLLLSLCLKVRILGTLLLLFGVLLSFLALVFLLLLL
ncbi:GTPase IMAP family member 8-like [Chelmon rostratus]|uniref:GTPase IMAP family member 8-like n=1 Tax=Chelmon rostratus TaxID=109905 RepID=UPI001BE5ED9F|nr:GTPase IMAP family member 8-like [Chelmon rostratus]